MANQGLKAFNQIKKFSGMDTSYPIQEFHWQFNKARNSLLKEPKAVWLARQYGDKLTFKAADEWKRNKFQARVEQNEREKTQKLEAEEAHRPLEEKI